MHGYSSGFTLFNQGNDETLCCFSIMVGHDVLLSKVNKAVTPWSKGLRSNIAYILGSAFVVNGFLVQHGSIDQHFGLTNYMKRS